MTAIAVYDRIEALDPGLWDALAGDEVLMSHGWLLTVEQTLAAGDEPRYFLLRDNGTPVAATVAYVSRHKGPLIDLDDLLFGRLRRPLAMLGVSALPVLTCQAPKGYARHLLLAPHLSPVERQRQTGRLLEALEDYADRHRLALAFLKVMQQEHDLLDLLASRGFLRTTGLPTAYLDLPWRSFSEYIDFLGGRSGNLRRKVRQEIRRNAKEGVVIERLESADGQCGRLYELMAANYAQYNTHAFHFESTMIQRLWENLGSDAVLYVARKHGQIVATSLFLKRGGLWKAMTMGVDHAAAGNDLTYFNIAYYRPIQDALAEGARRIYYGNGMYELKTRRGCRLMNGHIFFRPHGAFTRLAARPYFWAHRRWHGRKLPPEIRDQMAAPTPLPLQRLLGAPGPGPAALREP